MKIIAVSRAAMLWACLLFFVGVASSDCPQTLEADKIFKKIQRLERKLMRQLTAYWPKKDGSSTDSQCSIGLRGPPGDSGGAGEAGPKGDDGAKGEKGRRGQPCIPGPPSFYPSIKGYPGEPGQKGVKGYKGNKGQCICLETGFPCRKCPPSSPGPKGEKGEPGPFGEEGLPGLRGIPGDSGGLHPPRPPKCPLGKGCDTSGDIARVGIPGRPGLP